MKIEIRREAVIVTFDTQAKKFHSEYERNKFFRELHGWNQIVPRGGKRYEYRRPGLLDEIPHVRVADSAFIVALENVKRIEDFFDSWEDKVHCEMMKVMMRDMEVLRQLHNNQNS